MSDDLRKYREELLKKKSEADEASRQSEQEKARDIQERTRRVQQMAQRFLKHARDLREESGTAVHMFLHHEDLGFFLEIGKSTYGKRGVRATAGPKGQWQVAIQQLRTAAEQQLLVETDEQLQSQVDNLIRPLFKEAMEALLVQGSESAGPH